MKIKLTQKYRPFSHEAGISLLLPKSSWKVTLYPAKIHLENLISLGNKVEQVITPHIEGPLDKFTVMQDLERGWVRVFGKGPDGFFSYRLAQSAHEITLFLERGQKVGIPFTYDGETKVIKPKEELIIPTAFPAYPKGNREKIHFGCSKKQDWSLVKRRLLVEEILPIWFELGKHLPAHPILDVGTSKFLAHSKKLIDERKCDKIGPAFIDLFKVGFDGILSPSLTDHAHQGYGAEEAIPKEASPLLLLGEGARLIRSLLIQKNERGFSILPALPKELHAGRFTNITCSETLTADLEWSKKQIRRMILRPTKDQEVTLSFQSSICMFRMRSSRRGWGYSGQTGKPITLEEGKTYILDCFQR